MELRKRPPALLVDEPFVMLSPTLARLIGLHEAILLQQINFWLNNANAGEEHDGRRWIYNSAKSWHEQLPFLSEYQIWETLSHLEKMGLVLVANYNAHKYDRTKWYTINWEAYDALLAKERACQQQQTPIFATAKMQDSDSSNGEQPQLPPIPKSTIDNNKEVPPLSAAPPIGQPSGSAHYLKPVYTNPNGPEAKAARRMERLEKKATRRQASEIVSTWDAYRRARAEAICNAYLRGQAMDGVQVKPAPDEYLVAHAGDILAFGDIDPGDVEAATRFYYRSYNGMISMKKVAVWIQDWLARGKPAYQPRLDKLSGILDIDPDKSREEEQQEIEAVQKAMALHGM